MIRTALGCLAIIMLGVVGAIAVAIAMLPISFWDEMAALARLAFYGLMALAGLAGLAAINMVSNRRYRKKLAMVDGKYDLWHKKRRIWRADLPWPLAVWGFVAGEDSFIDFNQVLGPVFSVDAFGNFRQSEPAHGWGMQRELRLAVESTNKVRAALQGDDSRMHLFGRDSQPGRMTAALMNQRAPAALPAPEPEPEPEVMRKPIPANLGEAMVTVARGEIVLGQDSRGNRALWKPERTPHLGVWGMSGVGKSTRMGLGVALGQARQGWWVLVIDPEQEGDKPSGIWGTIAPWVQVVSPGEPGCGLWEKVLEWYEQRWRNVQAAGATDAYHMPSGKPMRPVAIHFDELARWRDEGRAKGGKWADYVAQTDNALAEIAQRGRKRAVHLTVYGQLPGELPSELAGNLRNLTFTQAENQGNKVGFWGAHNLGEGQFAFEGKVYDSFTPLLEAPQIMAGRSVPPPLLPEFSSVPNPVSRNVPSPFSSVDTPSQADGNEGTDSPGGRKWEDFARAWIAQNPDGGPSALAKAMAAVDGNIKPYTDYKSEADRRLKVLRNGAPAIMTPDEFATLGIDLKGKDVQYVGRKA